MSTISIERGWTRGAGRVARGFAVAADLGTGRVGSGRIGDRPLSFPARGKRAASQSGARPVWVRAEGGVTPEKLLFLALAVAGLVGIIYGFSCLVDLVQNWAVMERGISNLI